MIPEERKPKIFDWRFLAALITLALVSYLIWMGLHAANERDRVTQQNAQLIVHIQQQEKDAAAQQEADERQRATLISQQAVLLKRYDQLYADQKALLQWLREHNIAVPTKFVVVPQRVVVVSPPKSSSTRSPATKAAGSTSPSKGHRKH